FVGASGIGTLVQTGGTHIIGTNFVGAGLFIGLNDNAIGTFDLMNGDLYANYDETVGVSGTGTMLQSGGTNTVSRNLILGSKSTDAQALGNGTYNLSAGTLDVSGMEI